MSLYILGISLSLAFLVLLFFFAQFQKERVQTDSKHSHQQRVQERGNQSRDAKEQILPFEKILFHASVTRLSKSQKRDLKQITSLSKDLFSQKYLAIQGIADSSGDKRQNMNLAKARAQAVFNFLVFDGVAKQDIRILSPIVSEGFTKKERKQFRSVSFQFISK